MKPERSSRAWLLLGVPAVALALLGLATAVRSDPRQRNLEVFTEMAYSVAAESMSPNERLPRSMTQQVLVPGVIVRGHEPFRYGDSPEEAVRAGVELASPIDPGDVAHLARGEELYGIYCSPCHDLGGSGQGPAVLRGMLPPPPLGAVRAVEMKDGQMFHVLTRGQGKMASYAAQLAPLERWKVIAYVRKLQRGGE